MDNINVDLREKGLSDEETQNRPHVEVGNNETPTDKQHTLRAERGTVATSPDTECD